MMIRACVSFTTKLGSKQYENNESILFKMDQTTVLWGVWRLSKASFGFVAYLSVSLENYS